MFCELSYIVIQISEGQPIKRIYQSEDQTKVKLLTADFPFPFEMNFRDGSWKIDVSQLIEWRRSQSKERL